MPLNYLGALVGNTLLRACASFKRNYLSKKKKKIEKWRVSAPG
jgi:hypothetical protein